MAKAKRDGFSRVETNYNELDEKIQKHRKRVFRSVTWTIAIIIVAIIGVELYMAVRSYDAYEVQSSYERRDSEATKYLAFGDGLVKYSNDGIVYTNRQNELVWNQAFEMASPSVAICELYLAVYDKGGTRIFIINQDGTQKELEMTMPIQSVCVARQGTIAVLMKEDTTSYIKMFDRKGNELTNGEFYADKGGIPIDIALSFDAQKLAVDMLNVMDGNVKSAITFYNFGSVGQNEINNNVGLFSYADTLIPEIEYISEDRMIAIADNEIDIFDGEQKPQVDRRIYLPDNLESIVYDDKYIAIVTKNVGTEATHHITVYDMKANKMMETDTSMEYDAVQFLDNHELCFRNTFSCELYTVHGILRFAYTFDCPLYEMMSYGVGANYMLVLDGRTEEVRLQ